MKGTVSVRQFLLTCTLIGSLSITSCDNDSTTQQNIPKTPDKGTYVTSTPHGIVYWHEGKDTLLVQGSLLFYPRFSPDKRWIAYPERFNHGYIVKLIKTNGDSLTSLANGRVFYGVAELHWSPDGTRIACQDSDAVAVIAISSGKVEYYSANGQRFDYDVSPWSTDGSKIAFTAWYSTIPIKTAIYSINVRTGAIDTLVKTQYSDLRGLSWSADGQRVAFYVYWNDLGVADRNIYVFDLQTQQISRISNARGEDLYPAWSPTDPNLLAYSGGADSSAVPGILVLYDLASNTRRALSTANESPSDFPVWSSDGQKILFGEESSNFYYVKIATGEIVALNITGISIDW
jgi:Tol biopolymer transport system component